MLQAGLVPCGDILRCFAVSASGGDALLMMQSRKLFTTGRAVAMIGRYNPAYPWGNMAPDTLRLPALFIIQLRREWRTC
ncbi:hypothetical protein KCP73_08895 [Salmonella enterica subsp. enterica]|nr:hypothetical protein KCP73_08895 [Salmonella enterica subsp. enterica]